MTKRISLSLLSISILLFTFSAMYSTAQLMQLNTIQRSLFSQTPKESDKEMDETKLKKLKTKAEQKKMMEMKEKKDYKDKNAIRVLNPNDFYKSQENRIYSGPQPGEKLPPLMVTHLYGEKDRLDRDKAFDITAGIGEKPLILFLQDNNIANIKGMDVNVDALSRINLRLKGKSILNETEKSDQELQIGIVFLLGDDDTLPDWSDQFLKDLESDNIKISKSTDGREGPGSYGLNRNVSQTILIAKDGKVLHNFAFTQPSFYTDPHVLGGVAQAIDVEPAAVEKWLNDSRKNRDETKKLNQESLTVEFSKIQESIKNGKISKEEAAEWLQKLGITWEEGEKLLKEKKDTSQMREKRRDSKPLLIRIANPADFITSKDKQILSGPQPGEKLPSLKTTSIVGDSEGKMFDFISEVGDQPLVLFIQDGDGDHLFKLYLLSDLIDKITTETEKKIHLRAVFLSDEPEELKQRVGRVAQTIARRVYKRSLIGISTHGREDPKRYGLNRNVVQTIIIAKDGKVLYNFAFTKLSFSPDPHVLGAIVQAIGEDPVSLEKFLNERAAEEVQNPRNIIYMQATVGNERINSAIARIRDREGMQREGERERDPSPEERIRIEGDTRESPEGRRMEREGDRDREGSLSPEALLKRFDRDGDGKLNETESLAARRAMSNREGNNRQQRRKVEVKNPDEFKQNREKTIFSGPQPEEKLPSLAGIAINGEAKGKTIDFITKADKKPLVLIFQDEKPLGLRGLVGFTRLIDQINKMSKQQVNVHVLFLGDSPDTLTQQASRIVPHITDNVLLGVSPDGREGPGNYGLNRNVAQTILTVKNGKVLHNFALTQPMLSPDPYVLGGIAELIGQKPATVQKWLNSEISIIKIYNPAKGEKIGIMLLNGTVVQYDEMLTILRNLPTKDESMLIIHTERNVLHEQIVKVMDIAKEAGIDKIGYVIKDVENKRMESDAEEKQ